MQNMHCFRDLCSKAKTHKKAVLSQKWPRDAPYIKINRLEKNRMGIIFFLVGNFDDYYTQAIRSWMVGGVINSSEWQTDSQTAEHSRVTTGRTTMTVATLVLLVMLKCC